jgi:MEDS: MEthanogen/methylotroph, DcmR Sensory domain
MIVHPVAFGTRDSLPKASGFPRKIRKPAANGTGANTREAARWLDREYHCSRRAAPQRDGRRVRNVGSYLRLWLRKGIGKARLLEVCMTNTSPVRNRGGNVPAPTRLEAESAAQQHSDPVLRKTGIRVLEGMPWGAHICMFYESKADLLDAAVSYFEAGLNSNESCIWVVSDPITKEDAESSLRRNIPDFDRRLSDGRFELVQGSEWYLKEGKLQLQRIISGWSAKLSAALARGSEGLRVSGNAFWSAENHWKGFCEYEHMLDSSLADQKMIVLCTYSLRTSMAVDILDVARAHQCTIARRNGNWEFLETPELKQAKQEIRRLNGALDILSRSSPGHETLTPRE